MGCRQTSVLTLLPLGDETKYRPFGLARMIWLLLDRGKRAGDLDKSSDNLGLQSA